jgi:HSP20 family protein
MAAMERWRPWSWHHRKHPKGEIARWDEDFDDFVDEVFRRFPARLWAGRYPILETRGWAPAVDMYEQDNEIVVKTELPGMEKQDIQVGVTDETLTIEGERKTETEIKEEDYYCCERSSGRFYRAIALPTEVEVAKITATYQNGVLEVHLPKTKEAKSTKTEVAIQ